MAGQIIKRGERTWLVRMFLGRDPHTGKRRYHNHTVRGTKKDAQRYLNGVLRKIDMGTFVEPTSMTLNSYLDHWLKTATRPRVRERTYNSYESLLDKHVRPKLGDKRLSLLTSLELQALYAGMLEAVGTARSCILRILTVRGAIMSTSRVSQAPWAQKDLREPRGHEVSRVTKEIRVTKVIQALQELHRQADGRHSDVGITSDLSFLLARVPVGY